MKLMKIYLRGSMKKHCINSYKKRKIMLDNDFKRFYKLHIRKSEIMEFILREENTYLLK